MRSMCMVSKTQILRLSRPQWVLFRRWLLCLISQTLPNWIRITKLCEDRRTKNQMLGLFTVNCLYYGYFVAVDYIYTWTTSITIRRDFDHSSYPVLALIVFPVHNSMYQHSPISSVLQASQWQP